jgi:hypothetical protein
MGKVIAKARVCDLESIPKSIRWYEREGFDEDAWSSSIEVLLQEMLGGAPVDEDPIPLDNVDPHPIPNNNQDFPNFHPNVQDDNQFDMDEDDGHWAMQPPAQNNANIALEELLQVVEQKELAWTDGEELPPPLEG